MKEIILIGNYKPDKQFSMQIFESLMTEGYKRSKIKVSAIRPLEIFRKLSFNKPSLVKWLSYIDKFFIFPVHLLFLRGLNFISFRSVSYHICDHSNAFYLYFLPKNKTIITCHDVLAIRAGLGFTDTYCYATKSGQVLQRIILNALCTAKKLATVSEFTLNQLLEIDNKPERTKKWITIHNALSTKFQPSAENQIQELYQKYHQLRNKEIILHVGSDLERKNRKLLINMIYELRNEWNGILVLAGEKLNDELLSLIQKLEVSDRILHIENPSDSEIVTLYSICKAMIFPSYSEGFGWPIIEAQACGSPVITTNKAPMMDEVGGKAALYADPDDPRAFVAQFRKFEQEKFRDEIIKLGYENAKRFDFDKTILQYVELIKE